MDLVALVKSKEDNQRRYDYFKKLGYGEKASVVLALLTYGDRTLSRFLRDFDRESRLDKLYDWLVERTEDSPMRAIQRALAPKNEEADGIRGLLAGVGSVFQRSLNGSALKSGARREKGLSAPEALCDGMVMMDEPVMERVASAPMMASASMPAPQPMGGMPAPQPAGGIPVPQPGIMNPENIATDSYEQIEEKDAKSVLTAPTSTFRMTTNTASMGVLLNQVREGRHVDLSQVRIEEILNYFDYDHGAWEKPEEKFRINTECYRKPNGKELLYVNAEAAGTAREHQNVILLLDVSGSMGSQNKVTQEAIATIISKLGSGDVLSLVTYSSKDEVVFKNHVVAGAGDREDLMGRILEIEITGCTNGSAGIETAYELGKKTYKDDWNNQVILITDGDLNFGVTEKGQLKDLIEEKKKTGLFLSVIGTGLYNYKDDKLEVLTKHGNGTYCVINDLEDVDRSVNQKYVSLTNVVAKDVKAQVEFNPKFVKKYRLLGYENRTLAHEDFVNDKVISEPYGAGGHGVALYELEMGDATQSQELKYQKAVAIPSEELCTVKVRFKEPLSDKSEEISRVVMAKEAEGAQNNNARLAYFLYLLSEKLRGSDKTDEADGEFFKKMADGAYGELTASGLDELKLLLDRARLMDKTGA